MGTKAASIKFGSVVWVKSKKDRGPFDPKWERGKYMGPADDVREGHVVRLDDGLWLRTLHMRTVRDDEVEWEDEEHVVDLIEPTKRMRGKTKLGDPEVRAIRKHERSALVKELLESKIWDSPQAKVERPQMKEGEVWDGAAYINLGAYQHGGITSITRATEKFNKEAVLAARLLAIDHPGSSFTSVALVKNAVMPVHRDSFNHKKAMNLISPLKVAKGSCVWQELKEGDEFKGNYHAMWVDEKEVPGQRMSVETPTKIRPDRLHAPLRGEDGDRIVVIGYTVSGRNFGRVNAMIWRSWVSFTGARTGGENDGRQWKKEATNAADSRRRCRGRGPAYRDYGSPTNWSHEYGDDLGGKFS